MVTKLSAQRTGLAGVEAAVTTKPDLVLMDMSLPVIDGWEATKRIKAQSHHCYHTGDRTYRPCHGRRS